MTYGFGLYLRKYKNVNASAKQIPEWDFFFFVEDVYLMIKQELVVLMIVSTPTFLGPFRGDIGFPSVDKKIVISVAANERQNPIFRFPRYLSRTDYGVKKIQQLLEFC